MKKELNKVIRKISHLIFVLFITIILLFLILNKTNILSSKIGRIHAYVVLSGSMEPKISTGSLIIVRQYNNHNYKIGDTISYKEENSSNTIITHRIINTVDSSNQTFITKGDANESPDVKPISKDSIIGKVEYSIPYIGYLLTFVTSQDGLILLIIIPAMLIFSVEMYSLFIKKG